MINRSGIAARYHLIVRVELSQVFGSSPAPGRSECNGLLDRSSDHNEWLR